MKAKIIHLLPLINLNSNCEHIWKEISRTIFCNILFKYTLIKESQGGLYPKEYGNLISNASKHIILNIIRNTKKNEENEL